jgi:hypothetical protein
VRQKAPLCPNAKVPDELTQVDCPAKKQNTCPKKPIQSTFRNRCRRFRRLAVLRICIKLMQ